MIIERDTTGRIHKATNGKYYYQSKFEDGTTVRAREKDWWTATAFRTLDRRQRKKPVGLINLGDLSWWMYKGKHYLTDGHPRPTELLAFLALVALRNRWSVARVAVWLFSIVGTIDLMNALRQTNAAPDFGAAWYVPTMLVPLLLVTQVMIFSRLLRKATKSGI